MKTLGLLSLVIGLSLAVGCNPDTTKKVKDAGSSVMNDAKTAGQEAADEAKTAGEKAEAAGEKAMEEVKDEGEKLIDETKEAVEGEAAKVEGDAADESTEGEPAPE